MSEKKGNFSQIPNRLIKAPELSHIAHRFLMLLHTFSEGRIFPPYSWFARHGLPLASAKRAARELIARNIIKKSACASKMGTNQYTVLSEEKWALTAQPDTAAKKVSKLTLIQGGDQADTFPSSGRATSNTKNKTNSNSEKLRFHSSQSFTTEEKRPVVGSSGQTGPASITTTDEPRLVWNTETSEQRQIREEQEATQTAYWRSFLSQN